MVLSELPGYVAKGSDYWFCGKNNVPDVVKECIFSI